MAFSIIILTGLFYLLPDMIDLLYNATEGFGNISFNSIYLDVMNKRNFVYMSGVFSIINVFMPFKILRSFSYGLFIFSIFLYFTPLDI